MSRKDRWLGLFAVALVAVAAWIWLTPEGLTRAPEVSFQTVDGRSLRMEELAGRPVLVTFWATTCPSCVEEMPHLVELHRDFGPGGLEIIGVAMPYDPPNRVLDLVQRRGLPYTIALDVSGEVTRAFGNVMLTPTSFLIGPEGRIVYQKVGEMDMDLVRARIRSLLGQPPDRA